VHTKFWSENLKGRDHSEDLGVDGKIILGNWVGRCGLNPSSRGLGPVAGSSEQGNELSFSGRNLFHSVRRFTSRHWDWNHRVHFIISKVA
jgi:hypothetical protein